MAQILTPSGDQAAGSWTTEPLWSKVNDDSTVNPSGDGTEIQSDAVGNNTATSNADLELASGSDPASGDHIIRVRWRHDQNNRTMAGHVELWQGVPDTGTQVASLDVSPDVTTTENEATYTLNSGEVGNISDYTNLYLRIWGFGSSGGPSRNLIVDLVEFEIPDGTQGSTFDDSLSISNVSSVSLGDNTKIEDSLSVLNVAQLSPSSQGILSSSLSMPLNKTLILLDNVNVDESVSFLELSDISSSGGLFVDDSLELSKVTNYDVVDEILVDSNTSLSLVKSVSPENNVTITESISIQRIEGDAHSSTLSIDEEVPLSSLINENVAGGLLIEDSVSLLSNLILDMESDKSFEESVSILNNYDITVSNNADYDGGVTLSRGLSEELVSLLISEKRVNFDLVKDTVEKSGIDIDDEIQVQILFDESISESVSPGSGGGDNGDEEDDGVYVTSGEMKVKRGSVKRMAYRVSYRSMRKS